MLNRLFSIDTQNYQNLRNPLWFLLALLLLIMLPLVDVFTGKMTIWVLPVCSTFLVVIGMYTVASSRGVFLSGLLLGLGLIVIVWINYTIGPKGWLSIVQNLLFLIFFSLLFVFLERTVLKKKKVDLYVLYGVTIGYILIGTIGSLLFSSLDLLLPGSFLDAGEVLSDYEYTYFSFVTMTTLGYGDIIPVNEPAKAVVILLSLCGQLYLAMVVAIIVGKFLAFKDLQTREI